MAIIEIERGFRVRAKRFGDVGKVIGVYDLPPGRLLVIRLDTPDRFGLDVTTEWSKNVEICHGEERVGA